MDLHRLNCFITIVEEGSVSKAAEKLKMTQPPLSIMVRKMEKELNVSLFDRTGRRLVLTRDGEFLYKKGKELLASAKSMVQELAEHKGGERGTVTAGCNTSASLFLIPDTISRLREEAPNVVIKVKEGNSSYILNELRNHRIDFGIVRTVFEAEDLQVSTLLSEPLLLAFPPSHPLAERESVSIKELERENFILPSSSHGSGMAEEIIEACQSNGFSPNVIYWGSETMPMLKMAMKGLGVTFAPACFNILNSDCLPRLVPLEETDIRTKLSLVMLRDQYQPATVSRFLSITEEVAKSLSSREAWAFS